ncbi:hypothetical protein BT69DRAFT_1298795 [Atractiella rhizophila]|nr:hypothetical protein BT69DRAFT_1298795 [Atractiella rhizophila]
MSIFQSTLQSLRQKHPDVDPISLIAAFLILHELTAIVPLVLGFFAFDYLNTGTWIVERLSAISSPHTSPVHSSTSSSTSDEESWSEGKETPRKPGTSWAGEKLQETVREWIVDGKKAAEKVGRKWGIMGFPKEEGKLSKDPEEAGGAIPVELGSATEGGEHKRVAEGVANFVAAYAAVKILLVPRILLSAWMAPWLARTTVGRWRAARRMALKKMEEQPKKRNIRG